MSGSDLPDFDPGPDDPPRSDVEEVIVDMSEDDWRIHLHHRLQDLEDHLQKIADTLARIAGRTYDEPKF